MIHSSNAQLQILGFLFFWFISTFVAVLLLFISYLAGRPKPNQRKNKRYECGFRPFSSVNLPFEIQFHRVALLFLLFDMEVVFLFPWAVEYNQVDVTSHFFVYFFLFLLVLGFVFEWRLRVIDWFK